ncbi:hypothetical protein N658DRAFT_489203 [Parathielavia hyrcaniae]|uniref:Prion-inhibition and propagation HeLo domain-containing protein n=1 Tax=Parathielavia hyrcaniae TaxID=113614 RepID=A0AAN6PTF8_9PEZI|nr:hypothetical protein N658DRAFT_489203 [Parathielavia hyrcaniae]
MSGLEIPAFLVGVAGLFSSCVDAFFYFKLAQQADKYSEVVLLKLDNEKTWLLIWGENVGLFTASGQNPQLRDERVVDLIRQILIKVEKLLTDSEHLRASYGAQNLDTSFGKAVDYISRKSLNVFGHRRAGSGPETRQDWPQHRSGVEWPGSNGRFDIRNRTIIEDIESIVDISHLAIIEEATESSHEAYSLAAAFTRALTEAGTVNRRTLEERLIDTDGTRDTHSRGTRPTTDSTDLAQADISAYQDPPWDISSRSSAGGNTLWQRINHGLVHIRREVENLEGDMLGALLKIDSNDLSEEQRAYISQKLPLLELFIYCHPCVCTIHTAFSIGINCPRPFSKREFGLTTVWWEFQASQFTAIPPLVSFIDSIWLDCRLDHLDFEQPYTYRETASSSPTKPFLVISEVDYLAQIWNLSLANPGFGSTRSRHGRFIERFTSDHPVPLQTPGSGSSSPTVTTQPAQQVHQDEPTTSGLKRPSSSAQSLDGGKRQRHDAAGSSEAGIGRGPSENSEMEDDGHGSQRSN